MLCGEIKAIIFNIQISTMKKKHRKKVMYRVGVETLPLCREDKTEVGEEISNKGSTLDAVYR